MGMGGNWEGVVWGLGFRVVEVMLASTYDPQKKHTGTSVRSKP